MNFSAAKALQARVILLAGEEGALRARAFQDLLTEMGSDMETQEREGFVGGESEPRDWAGAAGTAPFLADKRIVVVRHLLRAGPSQSLTPAERDKAFKLMFARAESAFASLPETALLILIADDELGDDRKQRDLAKPRKGWEECVAKAGGHVESFKIEPKQARELLRAESERVGLHMQEQVLSELIEMCGANLSRSMEELEKLALYCPEGSTVSTKDLRDVVVPSREWGVFKLVDAAIGGQAGEALRQLRILLASANKTEDAALRNIFPNVQRMLRLVWQARVCLDAGVRPNSEAIQDALPKKNYLPKEQEFVQGKAMRLARRLSFAELASCFEVVADADARLKGLKPSASSMETLERMTLELVQIAS
ncbi:MAG: DNA polymerase III subunit delta [Fimbriimonas ginsengisoli]|uniref:DNA-directed DNA polymerase n=1 Tax=Fimbriimonas ginsengisoli TaxID=1005039 RepID=A0A931PTL3_FIMGI|nr:DNA polymerase III subunit delta [Fimbriimonas ginsengisoli]